MGVCVPAYPRIRPFLPSPLRDAPRVLRTSFWLSACAVVCTSFQSSRECACRLRRPSCIRYVRFLSLIASNRHRRSGAVLVPQEPPHCTVRTLSSPRCRVLPNAPPQVLAPSSVRTVALSLQPRRVSGQARRCQTRPSPERQRRGGVQTLLSAPSGGPAALATKSRLLHGQTGAWRAAQQQRLPRAMCIFRSVVAASEIHHPRLLQLYI